jgi:hypothetical protein
MYVEFGKVRRIAYSQTTRRSVRRGDLILCDLNGAPVASYELAAAPQEIPGGVRDVVQSPAMKAARQ